MEPSTTPDTSPKFQERSKSVSREVPDSDASASPHGSPAKHKRKLEEMKDQSAPTVNPGQIASFLTPETPRNLRRQDLRSGDEQKTLTSRPPATMGPPPVPSSQFFGQSSMPTSGQNGSSLSTWSDEIGHANARMVPSYRPASPVRSTAFDADPALGDADRGNAEFEEDEDDDEDDEEEEEEEEEEREEGEDGDEFDRNGPEYRLAEFDWTDLEDRHREMQRKMAKEEQELWDEFCRLTDFFAIWAGASSSHETDRGYKRLRTQEYYVRAREQEVEQRRLHYVKVIDAFKQALSMLDG